MANGTEDIAVSSSEEESSSQRKVTKTLNTCYLTDDIWYQIFPYFPLNLIFKLKCISKVWNSHLSSPDFIQNWIRLNNTTLPWMLIHIFKQNSLRKFSIAYLDSHSHLVSTHKGFSFEFLANQNSNSSSSTLYFLGSSNGLVLCLRNKTYYVCNPLSQKWVELPPTPPQYDDERLKTLTGFVCDCFSQPTSYKVVRIPPWDGDSNKFTIEVFSSDSGKWIYCDVFCPDGVTLTYPRGAFPRGTPNDAPTDGIVLNDNVLYWIDVSNRIVAYNLENNESDVRQCRLIDLPERSVRGISSTRCLGESNGSIFYVRIKRRQWKLCVWVLQEENFHLLHKNIDLYDLFGEINIKLSAEFDGIRWGQDLTEVFGFSPVDSNVIIIGYKHCIWAYNIGTRKYDELCHPSFQGNEHSDTDIVYLPIVLKPMPTILPPRLW